MVGLPAAQSGGGAVEVASKAVVEAGEELAKAFRLEKKARFKGRGNVVTSADMETQERLAAVLKKEFPGHGILSEESLDIASETGYTWIVDPLDGSNNFYFGLPFFAINLALKYRDEMLMGLTYDPLRKELFSAVKGKGASLNGAAMRVSSRDELVLALVGCDLGYNSQQGRQSVKMIEGLCGNVHCLRILGSGALGIAYVACGRMDVYFHSNLYPWDIAPGLLMVAEAGGEVHDWDGRKAALQSSQVVASSKGLYQKFADFVHLTARA